MRMMFTLVHHSNYSNKNVNTKHLPTYTFYVIFLQKIKPIRVCTLLHLICRYNVYLYLEIPNKAKERHFFLAWLVRILLFIKIIITNHERNKVSVFQ